MENSRKLKVFVIDKEKMELWRKAHNIKKKDMARLIGVSPFVMSYIYKRLDSKWAPSIADLFGLDGRDLLKTIEIENNYSK